MEKKETDGETSNATIIAIFTMTRGEREKRNNSRKGTLIRLIVASLVILLIGAAFGLALFKFLQAQHLSMSGILSIDASDAVNSISKTIRLQFSLMF